MLGASLLGEAGRRCEGGGVVVEIGLCYKKVLEQRSCSKSKSSYPWHSESTLPKLHTPLHSGSFD